MLTKLLIDVSTKFFVAIHKGFAYDVGSGTYGFPVNIGSLIGAYWLCVWLSYDIIPSLSGNTYARDIVLLLVIYHVIKPFVFFILTL